MEFYALHEEKIPFRIMQFFAAILGLIAAGMLGLVIYHFTVATIDNEPALGWFFLLEGAVMGAAAFIVLQFRKYELALTPEGIIIRFGRMKKFIPWLEIDSYSRISGGNMMNSGGWKIGMGKQGWYSRYTVTGKPRIMVQLNAGKIRTVIFSTSNPQEVIRHMKRQTGKSESVLEAGVAGQFDSWAS